MLRLILTLVALGLTVYAAIDCFRTPEADVRTLPRPLWLVLIVVVPVIGPAAWIVAGRESPDGGGGVRPARPVLAPDDDPDFLWKLEQERRRRQKEQEAAQGDDDGDGDRTVS